VAKLREGADPCHRNEKPSEQHLGGKRRPELGGLIRDGRGSHHVEESSKKDKSLPVKNAGREQRVTTIRANGRTVAHLFKKKSKME